MTEPHWRGQSRSQFDNMPRSRLSKGFDLEAILEDLEGDLRDLLEQLTEQHEQQVAESARYDVPLMPHAKPIFEQVRAVIPARDFELSKRFYGEIFDAHWKNEQFCEFRVGSSEFLLQDTPGPDVRLGCVLQVTSVDVQSTWRFLSKVVAKYAGTSVLPPKVEPWGTVVYLCGPSGESWCVTERRGNVERAVGSLS